MLVLMNLVIATTGGGKFTLWEVSFRYFGYLGVTGKSRALSVSPDFVLPWPRRR